MTAPFAVLALLTVASAIAAMSFRNLVHCALSLVLTFIGLAGLYLQLNAQFVGFAQILVYVGAVAILIVFAILLTRGTDPAPNAPVATSPWWGATIAIAIFATIAGAVTGSVMMHRLPPSTPDVSVKQIGEKLMRDYILPLEVIALLLTAAMVGAVVIAMQEKRK